jgi:hypothetical protein
VPVRWSPSAGEAGTARVIGKQGKPLELHASSSRDSEPINQHGTLPKQGDNCRNGLRSREREREREQYLETKQEWVRNNRGATREVGSAVCDGGRYRTGGKAVGAGKQSTDTAAYHVTHLSWSA